jgi:Flp pilus assembly protein TadB
MKWEVRAFGAVAAISWLLAIVALIDWLGGNPTAPTGIITFVVTGAVFTWGALYLRRADKETR